MNDTEFIAIMRSFGYINVRKLPNGVWIGVARMIYTAGLLVGLTIEGYSGRYCYPTLLDATDAVKLWDGNGDPPGPWIKYKGDGGERLNQRIHDESHSDSTTV